MGVMLSQGGIAWNEVDRAELNSTTRTQDDVPDVDEGEEPAADASGADNSEAALALLRALSRADPQVPRNCAVGRFMSGVWASLLTSWTCQSTICRICDSPDHIPAGGAGAGKDREHCRGAACALLHHVRCQWPMGHFMRKPAFAHSGDCCDGSLYAALPCVHTFKFATGAVSMPSRAVMAALTH
jgi:hypothetical protein